MPEYNNLSDGALQAWYSSFVDVAVVNAVALGLDPAEQTALTDARDDYAAARTARVNATAAALTATIDKKNKRTAVLALVGQFNNEWQANPAVPDTMISDLGLTVHSETPSKIGVFTPLNFTAKGDGDGSVKMKWSRNGNVWGCSFWIEVSYDNGANWQLASSTTKAKATLIGVAIRPGTYRVRAERSGQVSAPSSTSSVYVHADPAKPPLTLAA